MNPEPDHGDPVRPPCAAACAADRAAAANSPASPTADLPGHWETGLTRPAIWHPEFPPTSLSCPHGVTYWAWPNNDLVAALDQLNRDARTG